MRMKPRSKSGRQPAPFAVGEDVGPSSPARSAAQRGVRTAHAPHGRARATPLPDGYSSGDGGLAPTAPRRHWRRPNPQRAALLRLLRLLRQTLTGAWSAMRRHRRVSPGRAFSVGVPVALLLALFVWLFTGAYWQTRHVRIEGTSDPTLVALVHAQQLTGCNAFRCEFGAARQAIGASPRAQQVSIQVVFPDTTLVRITPRQTAALWRTQGQTWAVGADGVVVGAAQRDPSLATPNAAVVDDPADLAFSGQTPRPGARMNAALVVMARQLRISAAGAGLDPTSLRYSASQGFTMLANSSGALVVFGSPADAQATLADLRGASPAPVIIPLTQAAEAKPAQAAQGAQLQAEAAGAILARLAQSGASATMIDVRWGSHPYYR
jgi:hypothetical protein